MIHRRTAILLAGGLSAMVAVAFGAAPTRDTGEEPHSLAQAESLSTSLPAAGIPTSRVDARLVESNAVERAGDDVTARAEQRPHSQRALFEPVDADTARRLPSFRNRPMVVRERFAHVDLARLRSAPDQRDGAGAMAPLPFDLFDDAEFEVVLDREDEHAAIAGGRVWLGHVAGIEDSSVTLALQDDATHALVQLPSGERYEISYAGDDVHRIVELDPTAFPPEQLPSEAALPPEPDTGAEAMPPAAGAETAAGNTIVDLMVVYTAAARDAAGGQAAIESRIQQAVALANEAYANSLVPITHQLVHQQLVDYTEASSSAFHTALNDITGTTDGYLDEIHALRNQYGADVVSLLIDDWSYCGLGWIVNPASSWSNNYGFNVNLWYCVGTTRTLHHEIGHNQGLAHDVDNASASGAFPYSYGLQVDTHFHTVMAYDSRYGCATPCPAINYFSNPLVSYQGTPTGVFDAAENARSLTETRTYVGNWRGTAEPDGDADGVPDAADNCLDDPNPGQMDSDSDGYGNMCDGDFGNDGSVTGDDIPLYLQALTAFFPPGNGSTDMDGDGFVTGSDTGYFLQQLQSFFPGPSGLACAGTVPCAAP